MVVGDTAPLLPFCAETQIDTKERATIYSRPFPPRGFVAVGRSVVGSFCRATNERISRSKRGKGHVKEEAGTPGTAQFGLVFQRTVPTDFRREDGCWH